MQVLNLRYCCSGKTPILPISDNVLILYSFSQHRNVAATSSLPFVVIRVYL